MTIFSWTKEAILHSKNDRKINKKCIENVLLKARRKSKDVQVLQGRTCNTRIFQSGFFNLLLRIVVDITTIPWTIITFYPAKKTRYWNNDNKDQFSKDSVSADSSNSKSFE